MAFAYNASATFAVLDQLGDTILVFQTWFSFMNDFKKDFEVRRNIFGLCAIINCPQLPNLVSERLPDIMN